MGRIYRAVDKKLNEEVALKLIKPAIASEKRTLERFHNELKLAHKISHPNVGRMYEFWSKKASISSRWSRSRVRISKPR